MRYTLLPVLLLATACHPELEFSDDADGDRKITTAYSTTNATVDCDKTDDCHGKTPEQVEMGGGSPSIIPNPFDLRGHGTVWVAGSETTFALSYTEEGAALFAERGATSDVFAVFNGLPEDLRIDGLYKGDFISDGNTSRFNPVKDELLISLADGQLLLTSGSGIATNAVYSMDSAWDAGSWDNGGGGSGSGGWGGGTVPPPGGGGGGSCTFVGCP